jgi:transcriptional activator HAC1
MDSWAPQTPSQDLKFEASPAESFLSTPGDMYPPLFGTPSATETMNPQEIMSPQSFAEDIKSEDSTLSALAGTLPRTSASSPEPNPEKKPSKKRKSWGQVLPEPKTNLPPRYTTSHLLFPAGKFC